MSDYVNEFAESRAADTANRAARREATQDAADRRASLAATRAQIKAARGHDGTPDEPEYKPEAEWSTTERQLFAVYGRKPLKIDDGGWGDDD